MKKYIRYIVLVLMILSAVMLFGCGSQDISIPTGNIVEDGEHYQIIQTEDGTFYCVFSDANGQVLKQEGPFGKTPSVQVVNDGLLCFKVQAGTGTSTNWGYYFNTEDMVFSDVFTGIYSQTDHLVACYRQEAVVIQDIFDKAAFYKEISTFQNPVSKTVEPILKVEFMDEERVRITYLSGSNYAEVTEEFDLKG